MRPLVGTSTKMNLTASQAASYFDALVPLVSGATGCDVFVLPPFTSIWVARERLAESNVAWGAQDVHPDDGGAHTGDVSAAMLVDLGCTYVEVGHSERRRDYGETDAFIAAKVGQVLRHGMRPILCVGEPTRRSVDAAAEFVVGQLEADLGDLAPGDWSKVVVAYEPVWAIGVGAVTADPAHVSGMHRAIHDWLERDMADWPEAPAPARVIYGGSVDPTTADGLLAAEGVDGLFVGRAALDPVQFAAIVAAAQRTLAVPG